MAEFASKGVAGTGLGLGIAGTALGVLAGGLNNSGLFNVRTGAAGCCSEDHFVNRYELGQEQKIAKLEADKKLLESTIYTNGQMNDMRNYVDSRVNAVEARINAQDVYNATNTAAIGCINSQIACLQSVVGGITKTVVPITAVCPEPMKLYNSWTAPTTSTTGA